MKFSVTCGFLLTFTLPAAICAAEELSAELAESMESYCKLPEKLLPALSAARDTDSADAAAVELRKLLPEVYRVCDRVRRIDRLTPEQSRIIRERYEHRMRAEWGKVYEHIFRLQHEQCYYSAAFNEQFQTLIMMLEQ